MSHIQSKISSIAKKNKKIHTAIKKIQKQRCSVTTTGNLSPKHEIPIFRLSSTFDFVPFSLYAQMQNNKLIKKEENNTEKKNVEGIVT